MVQETGTSRGQVRVARGVGIVHRWEDVQLGRPSRPRRVRVRVRARVRVRVRARPTVTPKKGDVTFDGYSASLRPGKSRYSLLLTLISYHIISNLLNNCKTILLQCNTRLSRTGLCMFVLFFSIVS